MDDAIAFLKYENHNKLGFNLCRYSLGFLKQLRAKCKIIYEGKRDKTY